MLNVTGWLSEVEATNPRYPLLTTELLPFAIRGLLRKRFKFFL
jgi:hypothetical protein